MPIITVHGIPGPQGSKRNVGRGIMVESSKKVAPWRKAVTLAWMMSKYAKVTGPVNLSVTFLFERPKTVKRKHHSVYPDLDKLLRSTCDALSKAGAIEDDARIIHITACKQYNSFSGAFISVEPAA